MKARSAQHCIDVPQPARSSFCTNQIYGTGEMAQLVRNFDWSRTRLGPLEHWPVELLVSANNVIGSRHPMLLMWGEDLIQIYNDAFRPSLREEKHPAALGQSGRECWKHIWPIVGPQIEAVMETGEANWYEDQLVPMFRNGRLEDAFWTYSYSPVWNSNGEISGTLVTCMETTKSVLAKRELQQERERLAALFRQAPAFFAVLRGPQHVFEMVNPRYEELIGYRSVIGKKVVEAIPEAEAQGFIEVLDRVYRTGEPFIGHRTPVKLMKDVHTNLELHYLDFLYQPQRDALGKVCGIIVLGVDVTESTRAEEALLQSEKLAVVGRLASSIAHEINNPLESITNLVYLAQHSAIKTEVRDYLVAAEIELKRVSVIATQTLRFNRQSTSSQPVTAAELIDSTLPLFSGKLANTQVRVERRDRTRRSWTCFDADVRQVLSNLIGNAIDAMRARGGRLVIRSRERTDWRRGQRGIVLTVADTGSGIAPSSLPKIFEPFFTTKKETGTGLGLWISREIVQRHGGVLRVRSSQKPGRSGTVFTLLLPCEDELLVQKAS